MKLLFCPRCNDMFKLTRKHKVCECGHVSGNYIDNTYAITNGNGISVAIGNGSFQDACYSLTRNGTKHDRDFYIKNCKVTYCWVRPNTGTGNPHTKIGE